MRDALQKLQRLRRELQDLHRTTAQVLKESQRLIDDLDKGTRPPAAAPARARRVRGGGASRRPRS
jgi:hypothetical protein